MVELTNNVIDCETALQQVSGKEAGAVVLFLGTTREFTGDKQTESLDYECYDQMARRELARLEGQARQRWPIVDCLLVHRLGHLRLGEASVLVAVSTPHRPAAFAAAQWLMDRIKEDVPIWKRENWADGSTEWVHPGVPPTSQ